ncbi:GGDEF domain-containing protein [Cellulomonas carbonis]|uniref:GGDEF domain-containing protein n=1 Tax=Cellulomonas carbonis T26 TaxID=947969 RepID=A0A0A0BQF4_9CELL|nr:GGDEF domain-containing protein [Cellulomonas carbonis]KGM10698.1 hypothetical protein N868_14015 [Cellulomonas carbonis T26]GGC07797.1 hypothetical protein GCM10010972_21330 [Cellulomonas carbonis]
MDPRPPEDVACEAIGRGLAQHPDDGLVLLQAVRDADGEVVELVHEWVNAAAEVNAGRALLGRGLLELYGSDATLFDTMRTVLATGRTLRTEVAYADESADRRLHGRTFAVFYAAVDGDRVVCQYRDISDLRRAQAHMLHRAEHDELTGAANRRRAREHLGSVLADLAAGAPPVLVALADLDGFKAVNDTHGHLAGDEVLQLAAARMHAAMRGDDLFARYGGDEFLVVCRDIPDDDAALVVVDRLRHAVAGRYRLSGGGEVGIGISVGYALATEPVPMDRLLELADRSLYRAKAARGTRADERQVGAR